MPTSSTQPQAQQETNDSNGSSSITNIPKQQQSQQHEHTPINHNRDYVHTLSTFLAGVGSGALASIICAPLDLIRTRMQVYSSISTSSTTSIVGMIQSTLAREGVTGCFRGLGATLVTVPLFWGVYFPLYDECKHVLSQNYPHSNPAVLHCTSAVITGAMADVICNPLFVVGTRLQTQALHTTTRLSMVQTAVQLYQTSGYSIFWRGMTANLLGLSHVAIQFPAYEFLKETARQHRQDSMETPLDLLLASGLAKMTASLITYPHEVLRSRMMDARSKTAPTLTGTLKSILEREGLPGLYRGLPVTLLRVIPNCCITFLSYELILRQARHQIVQYRQEQEQSQQTQSR